MEKFAVDCNVLAIIQSNTPGKTPLKYAAEELKRITAWASKANVPLDSMSEYTATVGSVYEALPNYSVVHFACHGVQDIDQPLDSGLILHDGSLTLSKLMHTKLPNAQLAFLSACETAEGEEDYPDEAVHIAAGMLAAGFRDVIGTMWEVNDAAAANVADLVYKRIFKDGKLLVNRIPLALHCAVQWLRNTYPDDFMLWVPFIHLGP